MDDHPIHFTVHTKPFIHFSKPSIPPSIFFFQYSFSSNHPMALNLCSAALNRNDSAPQQAATTFAFASVRSFSYAADVERWVLAPAGLRPVGGAGRPHPGPGVPHVHPHQGDQDRSVRTGQVRSGQDGQKT